MRPYATLVVALASVALITVRGAVAATRMDSPLIEVSAHASLLTVRILAAPLSDVLRAIAARTKVTIKLRGDLTTPVTAIFAQVPLDEGLKRLARGHSVCLFYGAAGPTGAGSLREAWVIASQHRSGGPPGSDPNRRAAWLAQVQALSARRDATAFHALARLVARDDDPTIRAQAALALGGFAALDAGPVLIEALANDPHPHVRRMAARALGLLRTEDARRALERASTDVDPGVRREAARAVSRWGTEQR
jgi:hypothetical protein